MLDEPAAGMNASEKVELRKLLESIRRDGTLYAGTSGKGVLKFKANTTGWVRLHDGLKDHEGMVENFIRVLTIDREGGIYAGTFDGGVFRSPDGGSTWRPISRALPNDSIRGIIFNSRGLFVATGHGIFKTTDKGRQWVPLNNGLTSMAVQVLVESPSGSLYAGTNAGAFRSDDDGKSWSQLPTKFTRPLAKGQAVRHTTAAAGGYGDPLRRDPDLVLADVVDGKVTPEGAERDYGVVVRRAPWRVDIEATTRMRKK